MVMGAQESEMLAVCEACGESISPGKGSVWVDMRESVA